MKSPLWKKRAKSRSSARLLIAELETRPAAAGTLEITGANRRHNGKRGRNNFRPSLEALEFRYAPAISLTNVGSLGSTANVQTYQVNFTQAVAANDTVLVSVVGHQDINNAISVTDSEGNTYTKDADIANAATVRDLVFSAPVTKALTTSDHITVDFGKNDNAIAISLFDASGLLTSNALDQSATASGNSTTVNGPSVTTTQASELVFGVVGDGSNDSTTLTPASGFTALPVGGVSAGSGSHVVQFPVYSIVSSVGTYSLNNSTLSRSDQWASDLVSFKAIPGPALNILGTDGLAHITAATQEDLGTFVQGGSYPELISINPSGIPSGGSINWSLAFDPVYADDSTLSPVTSFSANGGTFTDNTQSTSEIETIGVLPAGTYHGELVASGDQSATPGDYFFTFAIEPAGPSDPVVTPPPDQTATEGTSANFNLGSFVDTTGNGWQVTVTWGDRTFTTFQKTSDGSLGTQSHTYAEEGTYTVTVLVKQNNLNHADSKQFKVTVSDAALSPLVTPISAVEGKSFSGQIATFTDANPTAPLTDFTTAPGGASIDWGDGTPTTPGTITQPGGPDTAFVVTANSGHTYAEEGSFTVTVMINDKGGRTDSATSTATVTDAPLTVISTSAVSATEGLPFTGQQVASFTDANPTAPLSDFTTATGGATIHWGDGTSSAGTVTQPGGVGTAFVVKGDHTYAEEGSYTITVGITDVGGSTAMAVPTGPNATVADASLTASGTAVSATEGKSFSGQVASFTDANLTAPLSDFTATITWGDGTPASAGTVSQPGGIGTAFMVNGDHIYGEEGSFTVSVNITDKGGSTASPSSTATVADAALTPTGTVITKTAFSDNTVATFTDGNPAASTSDFTATINWGDGTPSTSGTITQPGGTGTIFQVQGGSHTYPAGTYLFPVTVNILDKGGSSTVANSTASASFLIQGFASGLSSPAISSFMVTALDVNGNKAPGYTGTAKFTSSSSPKADLPPNYTFTASDAGVHSFSANLRLAGGQSITATDSAITTFTGSQSGILINPGPADHLIMARFPAKITAGVQGTFRVTVQDLYGNTINKAPFFTDTVSFTSSDPQAVLPANYTFTTADAGVHDFTATLKTAGNDTITVLDATNSAIVPGSQSGIIVQPAAMTQLGVSGVPPFITSGSSYSLTVAAQDAFGNTVPGYLGTVTFTSSDAAAVLPANYTFVSADNSTHSFMVTLKTPGSQSITATDTVTSSFTGTQSNIQVQTIQPTASVSGSSIGVPGQPLPFTFGASEAGLPASTVYAFNVVWGDDSSQSFSGTSGVQMTHTYNAVGSNTLKVTANDPSGNVSLAVSMVVTITNIAMEADPSNSSLTALFVSGTNGNDTIAVTPASSSGGVKVGINFVSYGPFSPTGHVIIYGLSGNDIIKTAPVTFSGVVTYVNVPLIIFSGSGNNTLNVSGSSVGNVVVGGGGANKLYGGQGRDILIAGGGPSTLQAGNPPAANLAQGGAILIGGTTDYDNNAAALAAILAEWSSGADYATRIAHIIGTMPGGLNGTNVLNSTTVHDNGKADTLIGGTGMDWFFQGMTDVIKNQASGETVTPIM
jgi:hypothetical protein